MSAWTKLGCLTVIVGSLGPNARGQTPVCGRICENTKWSGTIIVTCDVEVCCDKTLTINPGTEVRFEPGTELRIGCPTERTGGTLVARGNADARIVFTSNAAEPTAGNWKRILFTDFAVDARLDESDPDNIVYLSGSILEHCEIAFAGGGSVNAAVSVAQSRPYLNHCSIHDSSSRGLHIDGTLTGRPQRIENCEIWDCSAATFDDGGGIYLTGPAALLRGNHVHGCSAGWGGDAGGIYLGGDGGHRLTGNTVERCSAGFGGGIYVAAPNTVLWHNEVRRNSATRHGGGIYFWSSGDWGLLTDNTVTGNTASGSGGGLYFASANNCTLTSNSVTENVASASGGGIYCSSSAPITLSDLSISGNTAGGEGGGIYFSYTDGSTLSDLAITENTATGGDGGGLYLKNSGDICITSSVIGRNIATDDGGGLYFYRSNGCELTASRVTDNTAVHEGGALFITESSDFQMCDSNVSGNFSFTGGSGGIYVGEGSQRVSLSCGPQGLACGEPDPEGCNKIHGNQGFDVININAVGAGNDVNATCVWWGTCDPDVIGRKIWDCVDNATLACVLWDPPAGSDCTCPCGCSDNSDCGAEEYCAKAIGDCAGTGQCAVRPTICPDVYIPVCGCDGRTYSNDCYAAQAGVTIACAGRCCASNADCDDALFCNGVEWCVQKKGCCAPGAPPPCPPDQCCDEVNNVCRPGRFCRTDAECDNGLFCDGREVCVDGCCQPGNPVACPAVECGDTCNEEQDNCNTPKGRSCSGDANPCTADVCDGQGACGQNVPDGTPCPDGFFCSGDETCQAGVCTGGRPPCPLPALCDEGNDKCACRDNTNCLPAEYCGKPVGDCGGFGQCRIRPAICTDEWVPVCGCDGRTYSNACYAARAGVSVACAGECPSCCAADFEYRCVILNAPSTGEPSDTLPESIAKTFVGNTFYVEFWGSDNCAMNTVNTGIVSAYADIDYPETLVSCQEVRHTDLFNLFPSGECNGLIVNELGGSQLAGGVGVEPQWARIAYVQFDAVAPGNAEFSLAPADAESSAHNRGLIPPSHILYGSCKMPINIGCRCIYDLDNNCNVAGGDLGLFAGCWLCRETDACWAQYTCEDKDFDCNGTVAGGDLGWFAGAWLKRCAELDACTTFPPCRECNGPVLCPWPGGPAPVGGCDAAASTAQAADVGPPDIASDAPVRLALRLSERPSDRAQRARLTPSTHGLIEAGEHLYAEIWARDENPVSDGLTAVFTDVSYDPTHFRIVAIDPAGAYTLFAEPVIDAVNGVITRVGGATMDPGVGTGTWALVSVIELQAIAGVETPGISLRLAAEEPVSRRGKGLVPEDQVEVLQPKGKIRTRPIGR